MKVQVGLRAGADLPPRETIADIYHGVCNCAGAYSIMFSHIYPYNLELGNSFEMPKGQASKLVARMPCFEIIGQREY